MRLQPLQQGVQYGLDLGFLRRLLQIFAVKLNVHHRRQRPLGVRHHGDEVVGLGLAGAVVAEEVVGAWADPRLQSAVPVGGKLLVLEQGTLGGLDEGKVHPLTGQGMPVHRPLVGGYVHAEYLPLVRVGLVGVEDQAPPAQEEKAQQEERSHQKQNQYDTPQNAEHSFQKHHPAG